MEYIEEVSSPVHLFWTGGWDSTFRLLQLLLIEQKPVQPHYISDNRRKSMHIELETMDIIRNDITNIAPDTNNRLAPTLITPLEKIKPNNEISEVYKSITAYMHLGDQYDWLARYAIDNNIQEIELGIEKAEIFNYETDYLQYLTDEYDGMFTDMPNYATLKVQFENLFSRFTLPICHLTKAEMLCISREMCWTKIMNKTWFCHNPAFNQSPCGKCKPCKMAIKENFSWRIPKYRPLINHIHRIASRLKQLLH